MWNIHFKNVKDSFFLLLKWNTIKWTDVLYKLQCSYIFYCKKKSFQGFSRLQFLDIFMLIIHIIKFHIWIIQKIHIYNVYKLVLVAMEVQRGQVRSSLFSRYSLVNCAEPSVDITKLLLICFRLFSDYRPGRGWLDGFLCVTVVNSNSIRVNVLFWLNRMRCWVPLLNPQNVSI